MNLPKDMESDTARLKEVLSKALTKAPKAELNEMIWRLVLSNLSKEEAEEIHKIVQKFLTYGVEFNIAPNFHIIAFIPTSLSNDKKSN